MTQISRRPKTIASAPLGGIPLAKLKYLASMLEQVFEMAEPDTPEFSTFDMPLANLDELLAVLLGVLQDPACTTVQRDIESAVASIGAGTTSALCELITPVGGLFTVKVLAISVLQKIHAYVPATTQAEIESAVNTASRQATTSKKLTAAIAAAKTAFKAAPAATIVGPAESTAPQLASALEAASAI